jgi:transposase
MMTTDINNYDVFVGIDVDKTSFSVSFADHKMRGFKSFKMPANPEGLKSYFDRRLPDKKILFAYESGPTGYSLYDYLTVQKLSCIMVHPGNILSAPKDRVKTNRLDSIKIANQLKNGQLKGIRVPEDTYRQLRHLTSLRQEYAKRKRASIQRIKSFLLFENIQTSLSSSSPGLSAGQINLLKALSLDQARKFKINSLIEDLEYVRRKLLSVHKELKLFVEANSEIEGQYKLLTSIPGFGLITSLYLLGRVGHPKNLGNVREMGSFVGVVPTERSTGDTVQRGHITHMGDTTLRSLLVEASWRVIQKDKELQFFYERIKKRSGSTQIAIVAVARKVASRAHSVLKNQKPYIVR